MSRRAGAGAAALAALLLAGCGTLANLGEQKAAYGGVRSEAVVFCQLPTPSEAAKAKDKDALSPGEAVAARALLATDMAFSAVGDTLTLPYTLLAGGWGEIPSVSQAAQTERAIKEARQARDPLADPLQAPAPGP